MRTESGQFIRERDLNGFKLSPNTTVDHLETTLGISFPVKPDAVLLTGRNRLMYVVHSGVIPAIAASLLRKGNAIGKYDHRYHAFFVDKDSNLFTALHENMHGFNAVVNPDIPHQQDAIARAVGERLVGKTTAQVDIEKVISFRCFDEGMAQWAAIEAASCLADDFDPADLTSMKNRLLRNQETDSQVEIDEDFMDGEFRKLEQAKEVYTQALNVSGVKVMIEGAKAEAIMSDSLYITGYYFVHLATEELLRLGINTGEAITRLVKNPPTIITALRNPLGYVSRF